jgi:hypothetical protein
MLLIILKLLAAALAIRPKVSATAHIDDNDTFAVRLERASPAWVA